MYERTESTPYVGPDVSYTTQGIAIIAIILVIAAAFAFAPPRDPSKVIPGVACSVLSETEVGTVLGTPVRLVPTTGTVCRYVATDGSTERSAIVVARRVLTPRPRVAYTVEVSEPDGGTQLAEIERVRLTQLIPRPGSIAQR
jgi:hypothetical protein